MRVRLKCKVKFTLYIMFILFIISILVFELYLGNTKNKKKNITYSKESGIKYVTYLKNNNHYNNNYLEQDYNLVASLIDYFNIDYTYTYTLSENINYNLDYEVKAVLEVYDSDNNIKPIDKKDYILVKKEHKNGTGQVIKVDLFNQIVDYETYNKIVQGWKKEISPDANLNITFNVNWNGYSKTLKKDISDSYANTFKIPISKKTITITNPESVNDTGKILSNEKFGKWYLILIASTGLLLLIALIGFINFLLQLNKKKSKYDQKIKKILREFDRAITEARGPFRKKDEEYYIEVNDFMELMDVHDNLNEPIIYYKESRNKSLFVVRNGNDIYYCLIKRDDIDE